MSLLPLLLDDTCDLLSRPRPRVLGLDPEDLVAPLAIAKLYKSPYRHHYNRPWRSLAAATDTGSTITSDQDKFQVELDVDQFKPEEITVSAGEEEVTVEGKHEEKEDEHGSIYRHFVRRYVLPKGVDSHKIVSNLSSDGVLTITVPKLDKGEKKRMIKIHQTGKPAKALTDGVDNTHSPIEKAKNKITKKK